MSETFFVRNPIDDEYLHLWLELDYQTVCMIPLYHCKYFLAFLSLDSNDILDVRIHFIETVVNLFIDRL